MKVIKRLFNIWTVIFLIGMAVYIYVRYDKEKTNIMNHVDEVLVQASQTVKFILPERFHIKALRYGVTQATDDDNIRRLTEFARERDIRFLYSFALSNTNVVFTASSISEKESLNNPEVRYGFVFPEVTPTLRRAFHITGKSSEEAEDRWGKFYAVYWTREEGKIKWVAGAEYRHELYADKLAVAIVEAFRDAVFMALLCGALMLPLIIRLHKKIRSLKEEVEVSYKHYNADIFIRRR